MRKRISGRVVVGRVWGGCGRSIRSRLSVLGMERSHRLDREDTGEEEGIVESVQVVEG